MNPRQSQKAFSSDRPMEKQSKNQAVDNHEISNQSIPAVSPSRPTIQPPNPPIHSPRIKSSQSRVPIWRFLVAMFIQSALIVAVPLKSAITYANGQTVTLQTLPVDPYDLLRGYSQTLRFEISDPERLKQLPGANSIFSELENQRNASAPVFVTLEAPKEFAISSDSAERRTPIAWEPVAISKDYPENLSDNQIAIRGQAQAWRVLYGLETYYMPESQREEINEKINLEQQAEDSAFVVDVKIDSEGNSVPSSLWIRDEEFRF